MIVIHGLKNCDTCKKARKWAEQEGLDHRFHDVRADGLTGEQLDTWLKQVSWEVLLNRRGTTWRGLDDAARKEPPLALIAQHPALMKRPLIKVGDTLFLGWSAETEAAVKAAG